MEEKFQTRQLKKTKTKRARVIINVFLNFHLSTAARALQSSSLGYDVCDVPDRGGCDSVCV